MRKIKSILLVALLSLITNQAFTQTENWQQEVDKYNSILEQERHIGIADTGRYLGALYELSFLYYEAEKYNDVINISIEADSLSRQYIPSVTGLHVGLLARLADSYAKNGNYYYAAVAQFKMLEMEEFIYSNGKMTLDGLYVGLPTIVDDYRQLAYYANKFQDTITAKKTLLYACELMEKNEIADSVEAGLLYQMLAMCYYDYDSLDLAVKYQKKTCFERERRGDVVHYKESMRRLASFYIEKGSKEMYDKKDHVSALKAFVLCDSVLRVIGEDTTELFFTNAVQMAQCLQNCGSNARSLAILEDIEPQIAQYLGKESYWYQRVLIFLNTLYHSINDFDKAEYYLKQSVLLNNASNDSVGYFYNIASLFEKQGKLDSAVIYYNMSIDYLRKTKGDTCIEITKPLNRLLLIYNSQGDRFFFDSVMNLGSKILQKYEGNNEKNILECRLLSALTMAQIASINGWSLAEELWNYSVYLAIETGNDVQKFFLDALVKYVYESFDNGHSPNQIFQSTLIDNCIRQFVMNYGLLKSSERKKLLSDPLYQGVRDLVFSMTSDSSSNVKLYNYVLFCKQQNLNADIAFAQVATSAGAKIDGTNEQEERIARIIAASQGSLKWMQSTYDSIRKNLGKNDIAVEYFHYYDYRNIAANGGKMEEKYVALVARRDFEEPLLIPLCSAQELSNLINDSAKTLYSEEFVSEKIVRLLVQPLLSYAKKGGRMFFSPDGVLYNLAIENLPIEGGKTLGQKYGLIRCSSSRNIASIDNVPLCASAVLYGGIDYGKKQLYNREIATRKGWRYLPGTLEEVSKIDKILSNHGVKTTTMSGKAGTERSFLNLSGNETSIIHVATHGFFFTDSSSKRVSYFERIKNNENALSIQPEEDNLSPMQRSGLMFAGGNNVWMTKDSKPGNDDGVLLASEVVDMNLFGTELLVLSACETGLGDMSSEGVMGLQRAFKLAGVKTIVMSLWEVDDYATALMMETFYKKLMAGKSKREAFLYAQKTVREKYQDPKYWAAFIMLEAV